MTAHIMRQRSHRGRQDNAYTLDAKRAHYYVDHIAQLARAASEGVPVTGYFAWTLMDNFEWAYGYTTPFGLIHVDFETQSRRVKLSGHIYAKIAKLSE